MKQRGLTMGEVAIALLIGMSATAIAFTSVEQYQRNTQATMAIMTVRDILRQSAGIFGNGRNGYPGGTVVAEELVRVQRLPVGLERLSPGVFAFGGVGQLTYTVPVVAGQTRGSEQQLVVQFPNGSSSGSSACRQYVRALRGWAIRISDGTTQPVDGNGKILSESLYDAFWQPRCAQNNIQVTAWFR